VRRLLAVLVLGLSAAALTSCRSDTNSDDGVTKVAVAFYPIEEIVRQVGGDKVGVITLVPPGEEAHEYDPTPKQLTELANADIVFYLGQGFQPNVEKALESLPSEVQKVDLLAQGGITLLPVTSQLPGTDGTAEGETLDSGEDPHVWLAPGNMRDMAANVLADLNGVAPNDATTFAKNYANYGTDLNNLDRDFASGLARCRSPYIVSSHRAFAYLADAYDLKAVAIAGVSPSEEPSAKTLEAIADFARTNDVTTIFFEKNLPEDLAKTLADEVGATTGVLDTIESLSADQLKAGDDYVSLMRSNLSALREGLGCS
jgi:zinc transport system substrate-binding protein